MKNVAVLLLLFCTLEEVWGPATAEKRHWEQLFWERKELGVSDISLQIEKQVLLVICASCNHMVRHPRCVFINYNWINQLSNTTIWWLDIVYYIGINYMFRLLWPSSG